MTEQFVELCRGQSFAVGGTKIKFIRKSSRGGVRVKIGIIAPEQIKVIRGELLGREPKKNPIN